MANKGMEGLREKTWGVVAVQKSDLVGTGGWGVLAIVFGFVVDHGANAF